MAKGKNQKSLDNEMLMQALDRQTEALFKRRAGSDATPYKNDPQAASLFRMNKRLFETLVPVEPSEKFVDQLKSELLRTAEKQGARRRIQSATRRSWLGTALSLFTVVTMLARILASLLVVIAVVVSHRRRAAAAA